MRRLIVILFLVFCVIGITLGYVYWPKVKQKLKSEYRPSREEEDADLAKTRELLDQSKPDEAIKIIRKYENYINNQTELGKEWLTLLIEVSTKLHNAQQLLILFNYYPEAFENNEEASILVGQAFLVTGKAKEFDQLRGKWKNRETIKESWFLLDADKMLLEGKNKEAIDYLKSQKFEGKKDVGRLVQLGFLVVNQDPQGAWNYFTEALQKDPQNPIIRLYRARLLEAAGKTSLALSEYISAAQTMPSNLSLRDQVAEFLLRYKQYISALQVWQESLPAPSADYIWIKAWFWSHVTTPIKFDWKSQPIPEGTLKPLLEYLVNLPQGTYWDQRAFEKIPNSNNYLRTQQITFWLRLIQDLKDGNEAGAAELLKVNPFKSVSWNPELELALKRILAYRATGSLQVEQAPSSPTSPKLIEQPKQQFSQPNIEVKPWQSNLYNQLNDLAQASALETKKKEMPPDIKALLLSKEAFAGAFLTAGWFEAALAMHAMPIIPNEFPEWVAFGLTQAMRLNRPTDEALQFITKQKYSDALQLIAGELLIVRHENDAAIDKIQPLTKLHNDVGYRASWLLSLLYIDKKEYDKAKAAIEAQPQLAKDVLGQETLARIALLSGNTALADTLYSQLESKSAEAKSYLARKAFMNKDYKKAKELTQQLLIEYPTNLLVRQNMIKILEEEKKAQQGTPENLKNQMESSETPLAPAGNPATTAPATK